MLSSINERLSGIAWVLGKCNQNSRFASINVCHSYSNAPKFQAVGWLYQLWRLSTKVDFCNGGSVGNPCWNKKRMGFPKRLASFSKVQGLSWFILTLFWVERNSEKTDGSAIPQPMIRHVVERIPGESGLLLLFCHYLMRTFTRIRPSC